MTAGHKTLAITGASGRVGQMLVPALCARGMTPMLFGRNPDALAAAFPNCPSHGHDELADTDLSGVTLLHLAAVNTDSGADLEEARAGNVRFLEETAIAARAAGVAQFINVSSTHALDLGNLSPYAVSKREGAATLQRIEGLETTTIYLPAVHGDGFLGRLAPLNHLPPPLARGLFAVVSALKPTLQIDRLAEFLVGGLPECSEDPLILADDKSGNLVYRTATRTLDLAAAAVILGGLFWLLIPIWAAIRLTSPGPGIFSQTRVGRDELPFTCYKFRTMAVGTAHVGTHDAPVSAVTGLGAFLRRIKLDELPQAINLLKNEMTLIGPRPCLPTQTELIEARRRRGVYALKPGISGLAQVNGVDMSDPEGLARWDARYGALRGLLLDLTLVLATVRGGGGGDRVRRSSQGGSRADPSGDATL